LKDNRYSNDDLSKIEAAEVSFRRMAIERGLDPSDPMITSQLPGYVERFLSNDARSKELNAIYRRWFGRNERDAQKQEALLRDVQYEAAEQVEAFAGRHLKPDAADCDASVTAFRKCCDSLDSVLLKTFVKDHSSRAHFILNSDEFHQALWDGRGYSYLEKCQDPEHTLRMIGEYPSLEERKELHIKLFVVNHAQGAHGNLNLRCPICNEDPAEQPPSLPILASPPMAPTTQNRRAITSVDRRDQQTPLVSVTEEPIYERRSGWDEEVHAMIHNYLVECREAGVGAPRVEAVLQAARLDRADYSRLLNGDKRTKSGTYRAGFTRLQRVCRIEKPALKIKPPV
jgi:hypothetical protein